jgi:hypothetical protein
MLYRKAARKLLYNLTMMMFYTVKGLFVPTSHTITNIFSIFHAPVLRTELHYGFEYMFFSSLYINLFTVLDRILVY